MYQLIKSSKLLFSKTPICLFIIGLLFTSAFPRVEAQTSVKPEAAICKLRANNKRFELKANSAGYFQRISNIEKNGLVPIEIAYPDGIEGEKIVVAVLDGGKLDNNEIVQVIQLNKERKCVFTFQVTEQIGLFRLSLHKGTDEKIVQLWVGPEPKPVQQ
jgi:hypothetical protein